MNPKLLRCLSYLVGLLLAAPTFGGLIEYRGNVLPENNNPPFEYVPTADGTRAVNAGILTIENTDNSGSLSHRRRDPFVADDLAVFQIRGRVVDARPSSPQVTPAGVLWARWLNTPGQFFVFFANDFVRFRRGNGTDRVDTTIPLDTTEFHTYSVVKHRRDKVQFFIDGELHVTAPFAEFVDRFPNSIGAFQQFQGNPNSTTDWDYVRYAIGDDALSLISVPEPATNMLLVAGVMLAFTRFRHTHAL